MKAVAIIALPLALILCFTLLSEGQSPIDLAQEAWSPQRVAELRAEGRPVFVDFTAAWCVTCKVNEKLVLDQNRTKQLFSETNTAFLVADWTNKNDVIAAELESYDRAGVPLYLVCSPQTLSGGDISVRGEVLPQVLTYNVLKEAIARAQNVAAP